MTRSLNSPGAVQGVLVAAMAVWGLNVAAVKTLTTVFDPLTLAALRMVVASVGLTVAMVALRSSLPSLNRRQWAGIGLCALLMVYLNQILFAMGLMRSSATHGALIMALSPLVSAMLAAIAFRESLTLVRLAGVALGFGGVAAVVLSHPGAGLSSAGMGDLLLVAAVVSFAAGGALVQRLGRVIPTLTLSWLIYALGSVLLVAHAAIGGSTTELEALFPGWWPWALVLFSGVLATAVVNLVWNSAISRIGVARTSVFLYWVPVFGVLFAALLLGEQLTLWHLAGFVAVMTGTYLGTRRQRDPVSTS